MAGEPKAAQATPLVKSTKENLATALYDLAEELTNMYPGFITMAESEKHGEAVAAFKGSQVAQAQMMKLFEQAMASLGEKNTMGGTFAVCQNCGYLIAGAPPQKCPSCSATSDRFK
jgi:rubrerythrin